MRHISSSLAAMASQKPISAEIASILHDAEERSLLLDQRKGKASKEELLDFLSCCESPIEKIMLAAMFYMPSHVKPALHDVGSGDPFPDWPLVIIPQFVIARYRLDFAVVVQRLKTPITFAVECDGANYHYSIDARISDAIRDEYLRSLGIKTVRYGGQHIKKLAHKCADEIASIVNEELSRNG